MTEHVDRLKAMLDEVQADLADTPKQYRATCSARFEQAALSAAIEALEKADARERNMLKLSNLASRLRERVAALRAHIRVAAAALNARDVPWAKAELQTALTEQEPTDG